MRKRLHISVVVLLALLEQAFGQSDLIPPLEKIKTDRPRVLLRPKATPYAISLEQLKTTARDAEFQQVLAQLQRTDDAAAQAMVWLLSGQTAAAEKAVARLRAYRYPGEVDTFHIYGRLTEFGLAYDWLYNYPGFTPQIKAEVRGRAAPLLRQAIRASDDHMFHNYIWMSAGGAALWTLAIAGEDPESDRICEELRQRFNRRLYPAWQYLDGLPSEPMGYWSLYVLSPGVWSVLAAQSAFETDLVGTIRRQQGDWLNRHFENLIHSTLPDMRFVPWGDLQGGPNGGVTHEMAGLIDGATWALRSPEGAYLSRWLARRRSAVQRFYGPTAVFYMLYTRNLKIEPDRPPLSFLAGSRQSGHFMARSGWDDGATIVTFRSTDHFGDHHHYDQGSFIVYRNGLLAVDPPVYRQVRGPQQKTEHHNTLLLGGEAQRPVRGQWFRTIEEFQANLPSGRKLETGDILFSKEAGAWAAVAGQFAQAYRSDVVASCVRQLLFIRPDKIVVVDQIAAPEGQELPRIEWLLQLPAAPSAGDAGLWASNGKSWIRCRPVLPAGAAPEVSATPVKTHRASYGYQGKDTLTLVHFIEVGDGQKPGGPAEVKAAASDRAIEVTVDGKAFSFATRQPFEVTAAQ